MRFMNRKNRNENSTSYFNINNTNRQYEALTPKNDIENGQEYMAALDWALSNSDIRNIAISGPYGSGKSSVIESYLKKHLGLKVLRISLAAFNFEEMINGDGAEIDEEQLEAGILKQLFYSVDSNRIPQSRYRKLQPETRWRNPLMGLLVLIVLCGVIYFIAPDKTTIFASNVNSLAWWQTAIIYAGLFGVCWYLLAKFVGWFRKNGNIKELQIFDRATLINEHEKEESIFNKNMDEIVYFFETTRTELVIIEDLDRFKSTNIFVTLRELNNILNHYEKIKGRVKFIYAIKDDMFEKQGERTKFFDFIIPIVPYISSTNSGEILRKKLMFDEGKNKSKIYDISGRLISLISPYINDMRDLTCICNEFNVFKNTLKRNQKLDLNDEKMFALIVLKNLQPKEFANMEDEKEESIVRRAFSNKKKYIENREKLIEEKKQIEADKINQIEKEILQSVRELKLALVTSLVDFESAVYQIYANGKNYAISEVLSDSFDINSLLKNIIEVYCRDGSRNNWEKINIKDKIRIKGNYLTRIERLQEGLDKSKEESRLAIEKHEKSINELREYTIREIIEAYGIDFLDESVRNNDLLVFLLRHGYLDETYENYINYFHPKSINKEEMNFILGVRNHRSEVDYSYLIKDVEEVFDRLQDFEFKQKEILNFNLVDYVLTKKTDSASAKMLIEQLSNRTEESMSFIKAYVERGENTDKLIYYLCKKNRNFWKDITDDDGISLETRYKYLVLLLKNADMDDIVAQDIMDIVEIQEEEGYQEIYILSVFFESHEDVLKNIREAPTDKQVELIEKLDVLFYNVELDTVDVKIRETIFDNCHYELNNLMIRRLFEWKSPEQVNSLQYKNYTSILNLGYIPLIDYVQDNLANYVKNIVLGIKTNENEEIYAIEDIIEHLLPENEELCFMVLEKEKAVWDDIQYCCKKMKDGAEQFKKKIWDFLLNNGRIQCTWNNFVAYYEQYGAETCWVEYFNKHINILLNDIGSSIIKEEILDALMFADMTEDNFRKYVLSIKLDTYEGSLTKLNKTKVKVMIEEGILPYNIIFWEEMGSVACEYRVFYAEKNRKEFVASLNDIELEKDEINSLLQSKQFLPEEKKKILSKLDIETFGIETAKIICKWNFEIDRIYIDAAWDVLDGKDKYALLLNQINTYENEELPNLFAELDTVYHQLVDRTRHKFKFTYTDYNKGLLNKLVQKDYITSADEGWLDRGNNKLSQTEKEHVITGYVKQIKK